MTTLTSAMSDQPLEYLESNIGEPVWIISRSDVEYSGKFEGFDESLNVVLSDMTVHGPGEHKTVHSKALIRRDQIDIVIPGAK